MSSKFIQQIKIYVLFPVILIPVLSISQKDTSVIILEKEFIFEKVPFLSCHASTIAETPKGLVAAWFGGTEENNPDVEIWISRKENNIWTAPVSVANGIQDSSKRFPCWNPVLFQYPNGPLLLFYKVGPDPTSWWGELITSNDNGNTWSKPKRLPQEILGPIKDKPVLLNDGRLICPSSVESKEGSWTIHLEITADLGKTWTSSVALNDGKQYHLIQPSLLIFPNQKLQLLCRSMENKVMTLWSYDNGKTWSPPSPTNLPNPNSGIDAVSLKNGLQLLVYNPTEKTKENWGGPRSKLSAALSKDGISWKDVLVLEDEPGEFSYPAVIQSRDGSIHITYTWKREKIKHVAIKLN